MTHRGVTWSACGFSALFVLLYCTACSAIRPESHTTHEGRKLQQNECSTNAVRAFFVGEFRGNTNACSRCSAGRVAWCCRADNFATPETCMRAGPNCCSGPEYSYTYIDRDGDLDSDTLDDVWCMPETCTAAFNVNVWPVDPRSLPGGGNTNPRRSPRPKRSPPASSPPGTSPPTPAPECSTSNELRDFVGEYRRGRNNAEHNSRICNACAARGQVAWCCNSLSGDRASTDPAHCQPANRNDQCCTGRRFRYRYFEEGQWDWDTMDDVWCLPPQCGTAPPGGK